MGSSSVALMLTILFGRQLSILWFCILMLRMCGIVVNLVSDRRSSIVRIVGA